jgi:lipopolysaccharide export system protein LptC
MSEIAEIERSKRRLWARPGSSHDYVVKTLRVALPIGVGVLSAFLVAAPLVSRGGDVSFVLAKDSVDIAKERLKVVEALYRGEDGKGRAFSIKAGSAVQASSRVPIVKLKDLAAQIDMPKGPASLTAANGQYDMDTQTVSVDGPLHFQSADGYQMSATNVAVNLKTQKLVGRSGVQAESSKGFGMNAAQMSANVRAKQFESQGPVSGRIPIGTFSAGRISADLNSRTVVLDGRAHLHIPQGVGR